VEVDEGLGVVHSSLCTASFMSFLMLTEVYVFSRSKGSEAMNSGFAR
jgi:hypothetical protein